MPDRKFLRHAIEAAFLPAECVCTFDLNNRLTIRIGSADSVDAFTVTGIDPTKFDSSRAIAGLVAELKEEMRMGRQSMRGHQQG